MVTDFMSIANDHAADVLAANDAGQAGCIRLHCHITASSPEVSVTAWSAVFAAEERKHIGPMMQNVQNWVGCLSLLQCMEVYIKHSRTLNPTSISHLTNSRCGILYPPWHVLFVRLENVCFAYRRATV